MNEVKVIFLEINFKLLNGTINVKKEKNKKKLKQNLKVSLNHYFLSEGAKVTSQQLKHQNWQANGIEAFPRPIATGSPISGILVPRPSSRLLGGLPRGDPLLFYFMSF